jgi:hypothetical protein
MTQIHGSTPEPSQGFDAAVERLREYAMATAQRLKGVGHPTDLVVDFRGSEDRDSARAIVGTTVGITDITAHWPLQVVDREGWVLEALPVMSGHMTMEGDSWEEYSWSDVAVLGMDGQLWLDQVRIATSNNHDDGSSLNRGVLPEDQYQRWDLEYRRKLREMSYRGRWDWECEYVPVGYRFDRQTGGLAHAIEVLRGRAGLDPRSTNPDDGARE